MSWEASDSFCSQLPYWRAPHVEQKGSAKVSENVIRVITLGSWPTKEGWIWRLRAANIVMAGVHLIGAITLLQPREQRTYRPSRSSALLRPRARDDPGPSPAGLIAPRLLASSSAWIRQSVSPVSHRAPIGKSRSPGRSRRAN